jgi:hypothetical protein
MKTRKAYIGISYPLLYNYQTSQFVKGHKKLGPLPNPIIESPVGLMILYDEIWFLSRALCPINMRSLPYVFFVDEQYPEFDFEGITKISTNMLDDFTIACNECPYEIQELLSTTPGMDTHSRIIPVGNASLFFTSNINSFIFDCYVVSALQESYNLDIEMITNSIFTTPETPNSSAFEFTEKLIIHDIPNYLTKLGPYHECFEELRDNEFLKDFRKWILEDHSHIQKAEMSEMCNSVEHAITRAQEESYIAKLKENKSSKFWLSSAKTIISTCLGIPFPQVSICDATSSIARHSIEYKKIKNDRWQGFIIQSNHIINNMK